MNLNDYQELSKRTLPKTTKSEDISNYTLGLTGESGEVADLIKKGLFHGHRIDESDLKDELGDVLHYLAGLATLCNIKLEDVAKGNIDKLKKRYPNGFSEYDSINRKE